MGFWGPPDPALPAVVELCLSHGLGPVALANELLAFVTSKDLDLQLTPEGLDAFEHEVGVPEFRKIPGGGGEHSLTATPSLSQVLARRGSRGRRGRDERRGLLHDIHSLQELHPRPEGIPGGLWGGGSGRNGWIWGGLHPNRERCSPLTSVSLDEEQQEDELLDAYTTPCKVGIAPNPPGFAL